MSLFVFALSTNLLPAVLLRASADLAVTPQTLATVSSAQFAVFVLVAAFAGFLSDRWGKRGIFLGACALFVVGAGLWGTARSLAQGCAAAVLWGAAGGVFEGMSSALLCELFPTRRKLFMNVSQVLYTAGAVLGPWAAGLLLPRGMDWRWLFLGVGTVGGGLWFLFLGCRLPSPLPHEQVTLKRLLPDARTWSFLSCCLALFLYVLSESTVAMYANLYLRQAHAAPENWAIYSISAFWGAMLVGRVACAFLPEHHSYEKTLAVLLGFSGITLALQGFAGEWRASLVIFALSGLVFSGSWPLLVALTSSRAPRHNASLVGLAIAVGALGCIAAPPLMNGLLALLPSRWVYVAMALPMFLAAGCVIGLIRNHASPPSL